MNEYKALAILAYNCLSRTLCHYDDALDAYNALNFLHPTGTPIANKGFTYIAARNATTRYFRAMAEDDRAAREFHAANLMSILLNIMEFYNRGI